MNKDQGGDGSFEKRLRAAEHRQGIAPASAASRPEAKDTASQHALGVGLRMGVELVSAMVVAIAIGWALDHWLHTTPIMICLFVLLGGAAGVLNVWRATAPRKQG